MRPSSDVFDAAAYLSRVGLDSAPAQTVDGLMSLHRAQALAVPFENFDVLLGRPLDLTPAGLCKKLLHQHRGGYCFELNGLLLAALRMFGFQVRPLLARVHVTGTPGGRTHQLCLVNCGGREWLADVGFGGDGFLLPMPLEPGRVDRQAGNDYRLVTDPLFGSLVQIRQASGWDPMYSFDGGHVTASDIVLGHHYTSTHPASLFTRARVATCPTPEGRVRLLNFTLTETRGAGSTSRELPDNAGYFDVLQAVFGIAIDAPYSALPPAGPVER